MDQISDLADARRHSHELFNRRARARGAGDVAASRSSIVLLRLSVSALLSPLEHRLLERVFRTVEQEQVV
jgi:hypothetical protein